MSAPIVCCPDCGTVQFAIPIRFVRRANSANHLMDMMTAEKGSGTCPKWKIWGRCKRSGCMGRWWRPGWISVKVPRSMSKQAQIAKLKSDRLN